MTGAPLTPSAAQAAEALHALPPLATLGIGFMVIAPDISGAHHAYSVNISEAAAAGLADIAEATRARVNKATPISYGPAVLIPPSHVMHVAQNAAATLGLSSPSSTPPMRMRSTRAPTTRRPRSWSRPVSPREMARPSPSTG
jgi:hypothetical protein